MPNQPAVSIENSFIGGLKTEFTGLNFPENACTATDNCVFSLIGDVYRRVGIDYETNNTTFAGDRTIKAMSSFVWNNAGGNGTNKVLVEQIGTTLFFYKFSSATLASPLSTQKLVSTVDISTFVASGASFDPSIECEFAAGNGYLFGFHPSCDPFYVVYTFGSPDTIAGKRTTVKTRDFQGIPEIGVDDTFRPSSLSAEHSYNLPNQGWVNKPSWTASSVTSNSTSTGLHTWTVQTGLTISNGQIVNITATTSGSPITESGTVTGYNSGTGALTINISSTALAGFNSTGWTFASYAASTIDTWHTAIGNYPSNADIWWLFKNSSGVFDPATTYSNITLNSGPAPKGFYILNAFQQLRTTVSGIAGLTDITTLVRPRIGCWFQGRVWYAGTDAQQNATGDAPNFSWSENIYFSQVVEREDQFGKCYQINDPTSQDSFEEFPTDGGVIHIPGIGAIYKLFPVLNGLLVFGANNIKFITGSQGIGFSAVDYTVTHIADIRSISSTSFINVRGWPMFWNEEGIYYASPDQNGSIAVNNLALGSILTAFANIPLQSKKYARGDFDPLDYTVEWAFRSTNETTVTDRYQYDSILVFNTSTKAFYSWSLPTGSVPYIHDIKYIVGAGGSSPESMFKYFTSTFVSAGSYTFSFSDFHDTNYVDWHSTGDNNFVSYFTTGYKLHGQAQRRWQPGYVYMFSDQQDTAYKIQSLWNFASSGNSGKFSSIQVVNVNDNFYFKGFRRHKLRGHGLAFQLKVISVDQKPFNIMGWSIWENINTSI